MLVGRRAERARLEAALERARGGRGALVLLSGEAGVGKTRLAAELAGQSGALVMNGACSHAGTPPYGPAVAALRAFLRGNPRGLDDIGLLRPHLALILPELGDPAPAGDRPTLFEAVRSALEHVAVKRHALVVLDDLQWSDEATLELLSALAGALGAMPLLVIGAYRSDGLPRDHGLRRLRNELRRSGHLDELTLEPLDLAETTELLAQGLGTAPSPALARAIHDRTQGVPFFVEELAAALRVSGSLTPGRRGLELAGDDQFPLPDTVRDAVLILASELSAEARAAAEAAAAAGEAFDLELVGRLASDAGLTELAERGLIDEDGAGRARFRHALTREALHADVPWLRRRALHRQLAEALEGSGAPSREIATQWLGARDGARAREALLRAAEESEAVHAYRDAAAAGRQALELWPEGEEAERRGVALERYARCAQLAGELAEAVHAWRELAAIRDSLGQVRALADAHRRLAAVHELRGDRESAFAARGAAAAIYASSGWPADAAIEHLAMANHLRSTAKHSAAVELARAAGGEAELAGRLDLRLRALGLRGLATAKHGDYEEGLELVRSALASALEHDLTEVAAELYQRLGLVLYDSADYRRAEDALNAALDLCRAGGDAGTELACVTCMAYVLRERGDWRGAAEINRDLIAAGTAVLVAQVLLGAIHGFQGRLASARRLLAAGNAAASRLRHYSMRVDSTASLAFVAAAEGADDEAAEHCRALLRHWGDSEDCHYAVWGLRWAAAHLARRADLDGAHACAEALTRVASQTGHPDALAALAHALAETALAAGDADTAAEQLSRALDLHRTLDMPFERAQIELRGGVALSAAGERELALDRLSDAYRTARRLGARPLAAECAREVAALGESVVRSLGRRAAADAHGGGLSRREVEVVRLLAVGRTNREIAHALFLSQRTVDMHVRNILGKLSCRSRVEAAHRAGELGLLA
jgi:DNA-binding CsgD family transcriptional regulator